MFRQIRYLCSAREIRRGSGFFVLCFRYTRCRVADTEKEDMSRLTLQPVEFLVFPAYDSLCGHAVTRIRPCALTCPVSVWRSAETAEVARDRKRNRQCGQENLPCVRCRQYEITCYVYAHHNDSPGGMADSLRVVRTRTVGKAKKAAEDDSRPTRWQHCSGFSEIDRTYT